jgi:hypothetical protein
MVGRTETMFVPVEPFCFKLGSATVSVAVFGVTLNTWAPPKL